MKNTNIDFDKYAESYEKILHNQLKFFSDDRSYFSTYKTQITKNLLDGSSCKKILDFGSGIGLSLQPLRIAFPDALLFATDLSERSTELASHNNPNVTFIHDSELENYKFDLIFLSGVIHHVQPSLRKELFRRLTTILNTSGTIIVFDHNPFNPLTQYLVATCPFDKGVKLITKNQMKKLLSHQINMKVTGSGYCLFIPKFLRFLLGIEKYIKWLPIGGQYYVCAKRDDA